MSLVFTRFLSLLFNFSTLFPFQFPCAPTLACTFQSHFLHLLLCFSLIGEFSSTLLYHTFFTFCLLNHFMVLRFEFFLLNFLTHLTKMSLKYVQQHKVCKFVFFAKVLESGLDCDLGLVLGV